MLLRRDSRMNKRMTSIMTTITTPNKSTPSNAQISARISDNKYAILNLLDDQFEDVRQRTLSGKGRAIAQATKEAEQRMKRLRRPVRKKFLLIRHWTCWEDCEGIKWMIIYWQRMSMTLRLTITKQ